MPEIRIGGIGASSRPVTTYGAVTRAVLTRSTSCWLLDWTTAWVPASIATSTIGVASAAVRHRFADRLVLASRPDAPSPRNGRASIAAGTPSSTRPSRPTPIASTRPMRIANEIAQMPLNTSAIATPPPTNSRPVTIWSTLGRGRSIAASRERLGRTRAPGAPGGGEHRELRDQHGAAERRGERDPRGAGCEAARDDVALAEQRDDRAGQRPPGQQAEHAGDERDDQRLTGDQAPDLMRRGAEGAHHGDLAAALDDRERERPGHDEQRDEAGDPAHGPEDGHERGPVGTARVAGVGIGRVLAVEHLERRRDARHVPRTTMALTWSGAPERRAATRSAKKSVGAAEPRTRPVTR